MLDLIPPDQSQKMPAHEDLLRVTAFMYRKEGLTEEEFHHHWSNIHGPKMIELSQKYGVLEYRQVRGILI